MFVSASYLGIHYGVDDKIAKFFVDREPPVDNLYWKNKLLYLRPEPGFLFIPLIVDILLKLGISREQLIDESFVGLLEKVGHVSALEETEQLTEEEAIAACIKLVQDSKNETWKQELIKYFAEDETSEIRKLRTPFNALHRGDLFLFSLCDLNFPVELHTPIAKYWFALISTLLVLDDAEDITIDQASGDDNAFLEAGMTPEGVEKVKELVKQNLLLLGSLNNSMALRLDRQYKQLIEQPHIQQLLNQ